MVARSFILVALAATQLPCRALAQGHGFIGLSGGASHISRDSYEVPADNRPSFGARAGYGWSRVMIVLDYQRHGLGDEQPSPSDWPPGTGAPVRVPQILETDFLLLGAQIHLPHGLYVRPALGMGWRALVSYTRTANAPAVGIDSAYVTKAFGPAVGASMGYQLKLHPRFSLGIEASALLTAYSDGEQSSTALGIQVVPQLSF
jgi:hypothetical protein